MIKYKLTDQKLQTRGGFQWVVGEKQTIAQPGIVMCSNKVFHYYASPEQAVLFNPIHANIEKPRLFEVEIDKEVAFDGLKGGCHQMTLIREIPLPKITIEQRVAFAIKVALKVHSDPGFVSWAERWLSGEDRSEKSAWAAEAAWAAWAARAVAAWAARAAWAAWAAAEAARAAVAAEAAEAAEAARAAAEAAWAAEAAGSTQIDFQSVIEEVLNANI